jgi:hypothetical protein
MQGFFWLDIRHRLQYWHQMLGMMATPAILSEKLKYLLFYPQITNEGKPARVFLTAETILLVTVTLGCLEALLLR